MVTMWVRKSAARAPAVVASTALVVVAAGVLPSLVAGAVLVGGLAGTVVFLAGHGEEGAVRLLWRARPATTQEWAALAPVVARLPAPPARRDRAGVWRLLVSTGGVLRVHGVGRRTLVVSAVVPAALEDGRIELEDAVTLLGHGAFVVLSGAVRSDPVIAWWTMPAQLLGGAVTGIGRLVPRRPLVSTLWLARAVVATIAAMQAAASGEWLPAGLLAALTAVSYLAPIWSRRWQQTVDDIGHAGILSFSSAGALPTSAVVPVPAQVDPATPPRHGPGPGRCDAGCRGRAAGSSTRPRAQSGRAACRSTRAQPRG